MKRDPNFKVIKTSHFVSPETNIATDSKKSSENVQNMATIVKSGSVQLDWLLGNGISLGSIILFDQHFEYPHYHHYICSFAYEALKSQQNLIWVSYRDKFIVSKPTEMKFSAEDELKKHKLVPDPCLNIAWRYQSLKISFEDSPPNKPGFSLLKLKYHINSKDYLRIDSTKITKDKLLEMIKDKIDKLQQNNIICLILEDFGGLSWNHFTFAEYIKFIYQIKYLVKNNACVCYISCPTYFVDQKFLGALINIVDFRINLIPSPQDSSNKKYDGMVEVFDYSKMNESIIEYPRRFKDLVFSIKNSRILIEKISLSSLENIEESKPSLACSSNLATNVDDF